MYFISSCLQYFDFLAVVRDLDGYIYFRENEGCLLAGGFEPEAKPAFEDGTIPGKTERIVLLDFIHRLVSQKIEE
jgi:pyruvate dehydrogenase phosphatase regulatory subunit